MSNTGLAIALFWIPILISAAVIIKINRNATRERDELIKEPVERHEDERIPRSRDLRKYASRISTTCDK